MRVRERFKREVQWFLSRRGGRESLLTYEAYAKALTFLWRSLFPERGEGIRLRDVLHRGDVCLDIGANVGAYTVMFSRLVGREGRVYAFEPVSETFSVLTRVVRLLRLGNVVCYRCALDERAGEITMSVPVLWEREGVRLLDAPSAHVAMKEEATESVPAFRLDDFLEEWSSRRVAFVKCDVEGAELRVFRGGVAFLAKHRPTILCEVASRLTRRLGYEPEDVFAFFADQRYCSLATPGSDYWLVPVEKWEAFSKAMRKGSGTRIGFPSGLTKA